MPMDLTSKTPAEGLFDSKARRVNLGKIEDLLARLAPPKWPDEVFGRIDRSKVAQGWQLFAQRCGPDGQALPFAVNDEAGASTPDGTFRVFAGLRSDPFNLAWVGETKVPNVLQHDNVFAIVIEFATERVLSPHAGSLFGAIAEATPLIAGLNPVERPPLRYDQVGRREQTNMSLNNGGLKHVDDLRDLRSQQTPFAIAQELKSLSPHERINQ